MEEYILTAKEFQDLFRSHLIGGVEFNKTQQLFKAMMEDMLDVEIWDAYSKFENNISIDQLQGFDELNTTKAYKQVLEPNQVISVIGTNSVGIQLFKRNLERTAIITSNDQLKEDANGDINIDVFNFNNTYIRDGLPMDTSFTYYSQPFVSPCYGSGFLLDDDIFLTAGHVLSIDNIIGLGESNATKMKTNLENLRIIRDFNAAMIRATVPKANIYRLTKASCSEIANNTMKKNYDMRSGIYKDWAWVKVESAYPSHPPLIKPSLTESIFSTKPRLTFNRQNLKGNKVYCIGHPLGLPVKVAYRGMITSGKISDEQFTCNLNTLSGNSGSPVFDAHTHELIGILAGNNGFLDRLVEVNGAWLPGFMINNYYGAYASRIQVSLQSLLDSILYR